MSVFGTGRFTAPLQLKGKQSVSGKQQEEKKEDKTQQVGPGWEGLVRVSNSVQTPYGMTIQMKGL